MCEKPKYKYTKYSDQMCALYCIYPCRVVDL